MLETSVAAIEVMLCATDEAEAPVAVELVQSESAEVPVHRVMAVDFFSYFA